MSDYTPMSEEHRQKLKAAHRSRLGIPDGFHRIYGILVPEHLHEEFVEIAAGLKEIFGDAELPVLLLDELSRRGIELEFVR